MGFPNPTTGLSVAAQVVETSLYATPPEQTRNVYLSLSSATYAQYGALSPTYQTTMAVEDLSGATVPTDVNIVYLSREPLVATVNSSGLITAVAIGCALVEANYPFASNDEPLNPDGTYQDKIYKELNVFVLV